MVAVTSNVMRLYASDTAFTGALLLALGLCGCLLGIYVRGLA